MESMLNKLRSTVSSAASNAVSNAVSIASQVSNYLPGNPVTREFEATAHIGSAGPGLVWKIYSGYKKSTKQEAAIFLFEKRQLDRWDKSEREKMLDNLRKGVSQLTRLRHPQILTVQHPLEESRDTLAFATEPVLASLANVFGYRENVPIPLPTQLKEYKLHDLEIKYGLLQISEGLNFLHNSVKSVHRNICLENIVLNHQGAWKIFGFEFAVSNSCPPDKDPQWPFIEYDPSLVPESQPHLDYLAPEYTLTHTLDPAVDMFSLGVIVYALFNDGKPVFDNNQSYNKYQKNSCDLKDPKHLKLNNIPVDLREHVKLLLNATPQLRPDAVQFTKHKYFEDIGVKTLSYLDQMFQWDNMQKSQFYKGLPQIIPQLPHRVCVLRIVPCLMKECVNPSMVPFVLPVVLLITEKTTTEEFVQKVLPSLKPIMKLSEPIQIMLQFMQKMDLLLAKTPPEDVRIDVLPLLYRALESDTQQIQELCLNVIPTCAPLVDTPTIKNAIISRIRKLCLGTNYLSVRVNCLVCIGKLLEYLDKWLIVDEVFPFLAQVPNKEAPVIMAIVGIYKVTLHHQKLGISKEVLANKVLPFMFPLSIENSLSPAQHTSIMVLIREMTDKVESEHRAKLDHLNSIKDEQKSLQMNMPTSITPSKSGTPSSTELDKMFSGLGLDEFMSASSVKPEVEVNNTKVPKSDSLSSPTMTLEDKQRIAKQQSMGSTNKTIPPLLPSPPSVQSPTSPKDLTQTLINSNLSVMKTNSNVTQTKLVNQPTTVPASVSFMNSMNTLRTLNTMNSSNTMVSSNLGAFGNWTPVNVPAVQPQPMVNNFNMIAQPPVGPPMMGLNQMPNMMGSFQAMNPMQVNNVNATNTRSTNSSSFKPLSSSDINDFLS